MTNTQEGGNGEGENRVRYIAVCIDRLSKKKNKKTRQIQLYIYYIDTIYILYVFISSETVIHNAYTHLWYVRRLLSSLVPS